MKYLPARRKAPDRFSCPRFAATHPSVPGRTWDPWLTRNAFGAGRGGPKRTRRRRPSRPELTIRGVLVREGHAAAIRLVGGRLQKSHDRIDVGIVHGRRIALVPVVGKRKGVHVATISIGRVV